MSIHLFVSVVFGMHDTRGVDRGGECKEMNGDQIDRCIGRWIRRADGGSWI